MILSFFQCGDQFVSLFVTVSRGFPHEGDYKCAHKTDDYGNKEYRIPSVVVGEETEDDT